MKKFVDLDISSFIDLLVDGLQPDSHIRLFSWPNQDRSFDQDILLAESNGCDNQFEIDSIQSSVNNSEFTEKLAKTMQQIQTGPKLDTTCPMAPSSKRIRTTWD